MKVEIRQLEDGRWRWEVQDEASGVVLAIGYAEDEPGAWGDAAVSMAARVELPER